MVFRLWNDRKLASYLTYNAYRTASTFTWDKVIGKLEGIFKLEIPVKKYIKSVEPKRKDIVYVNIERISKEPFHSTVTGRMYWHDVQNIKKENAMELIRDFPRDFQIV